MIRRAAVAAVLLLAGCARTHGSGHFHAKMLSHVAVERYIAVQLHTPVTCNGGRDFPLTRNGATFQCKGDGLTSVRYTVTITNWRDGMYLIK